MTQYFACLCNFMYRYSCFQFYSTVLCFEKRIQTIPLALICFMKKKQVKIKIAKQKKDHFGFNYASNRRKKYVVNTAFLKIHTKIMHPQKYKYGHWCSGYRK